MTHELVIAATTPPAPRGMKLDGRSLAVRRSIALTRTEAYRTGRDFPDHDGYFPEDSTLRMIYENPMAVALANIAAFTVGMTDERNATPTIASMQEKGRVVGRNADTALAFNTVVTRSYDEADAVGNGVFVGHAAVHARAMEQVAGPHPERAAYDPFDPDRQLWTTGVLAWGLEHGFETVVRPLTSLERPILRKIDNPLFAGLFGSGVPKDPDRFVRDRLASGELHLTDAARKVAMRNWYGLTVPRFMKPAKLHLVRAVLGMLPEEVRDMYGLEYGPQQEEEFQESAAKLAKVNSLLKLSRNSDRWIFHEADRAEQRLLERDKLPPIPDPYAEAA